MLKRIRVYWSRYESALITRPLFTKVSSAAAIGCIADTFAQQCTQGHEEDSRFDILRTLSFTVFAGGWTGGIQSFLFDAYARISFRNRPTTVACRLLAHQFVVVPLVYFPSFFLTTELLQGSTFRGAVQRWESRWWLAAKANWMLWVPASTLQFAIIPVRFQVIYVSCIGLIWQTVLSLVSNGPSGCSDMCVDPAFDLAGPGTRLEVFRTYLEKNSKHVASSLDVCSEHDAGI